MFMYCFIVIKYVIIILWKIKDSIGGIAYIYR